MKPKLIIADDHRMVAEGVQHILDEDFDLLDIVADGEALVDAVQRLEPDLVVADINMPRCNGMDALKRLRQAGMETRFVFLTMHMEPALAVAALRAGARGYILKNSAGEDLRNAAQQVMSGGTYVTPALGARYISGQMADMRNLTAKQLQVLRLVGSGLRSKQIALQLGLSVRTVEAHKYTMMQVLGVHSTLELVRRAEDLGLLF
ncbi:MULTISPECIES: response regulator transcription factor [unclassified Dyella]|uniref:response regulator n=1 Tax=unclassified Dyella TaxID=2634549 RepID=UPI001E4EC8B6|nr:MULTISPECIES: response regulator transcription factor [unclassified Dyella]MDR3446620.1 response regulator transcription factor [Dyella sp.]